MAGMEGLEVTFSGLTGSVAQGLIDGRAVPAVASVVVTAATTTFRGFLISEDGDGTYTVTMGTDDGAASAALAADAALLIAVPAGGVALLTGAVNNTTVVSLTSMERRGELPAISKNF
jgi:hypothetical protein